MVFLTAWLCLMFQPIFLAIMLIKILVIFYLHSWEQKRLKLGG